MVLCIVALIALSVLGIFSAYYRRLAKEAFECVMKMLVFQPCTTKFDERLKSKVTIKLMRVPKVARFFYKNFKLLSWIFTISFFASLVYSAYGIYNLIVYGSCDPSSGTCYINQGKNVFVEFLSCHETEIIYAIAVFVVAAIVLMAYKRTKRKA